MLYFQKNRLNKIISLTFLSVIFLLAACKKDKTGTATSAIDGTYNFKNISAQTVSRITGSLGDEALSRANYTTTNNGGTVTFSNGTITAKGLTYTVNSQATLYEYDSGSLIDSLSYPFVFTLPPSNSSGQYKLVGADSIYFPQGGITVAVDGSTSYSGQPGGGHYSISGKVLTIVQSVSKDSSFTDAGESYLLHESAVASVSFEK